LVSASHSVFIPSKNVCWDFLAKKTADFGRI
jgi:hypothetical protein